jgi:hypothetical protein
MSQVNHYEPFDENDKYKDIRSNECSKWILETTIGTIGDGNVQGNEYHSMNALLEVP